MLQKLTRERLQALVYHPDFAYISVAIDDKKMFHSSGNGKPTFYTDVNIHTEGEPALLSLMNLIPEIVLTKQEPIRTEHEDHVSIGEYATGKLEGCSISFWSTFLKIPKEKAPAPTGAIEEISQINYTTESEVVANA